MILRPNQLEGASDELKAQIEAFAKVAEEAKWDIYPCRHEGGDKVFLGLYRQVRTEVASKEVVLSLMPPTLQHLGGCIFTLKTPMKPAK